MSITRTLTDHVPALSFTITVSVTAQELAQIIVYLIANHENRVDRLEDIDFAALHELPDTLQKKIAAQVRKHIPLRQLNTWFLEYCDKDTQDSYRQNYRFTYNTIDKIFAVFYYVAIVVVENDEVMLTLEFESKVSK